MMYRVPLADARVVDKDYQEQPMGRLLAFCSWTIDKLFNSKGYYDDGRPVPTWNQLRKGR